MASLSHSSTLGSCFKTHILQVDGQNTKHNTKALYLLRLSRKASWFTILIKASTVLIFFINRLVKEYQTRAPQVLICIIQHTL